MILKCEIITTLFGCIILSFLLSIFLLKRREAATPETDAASTQTEPRVAQDLKRAHRSVPAKKQPWGFSGYHCRRKTGRSPKSQRWVSFCYRRQHRSTAADPWSIWCPADINSSVWRRMANATTGSVALAVATLILSFLCHAGSQAGLCSAADTGLTTAFGLMPPCSGMQCMSAVLGLLFASIGGILIIKPFISTMWLLLRHLAVITQILYGVLALCCMVMTWLMVQIYTSFIRPYCLYISSIVTGHMLTRKFSLRRPGRNLLQLVFIFTLLGTVHCTRFSVGPTDGDYRTPRTQRRSNARAK